MKPEQRVDLMDEGLELVQAQEDGLSPISDVEGMKSVDAERSTVESASEDEEQASPETAKSSREIGRERIQAIGESLKAGKERVAAKVSGLWGKLTSFGSRALEMGQEAVYATIGGVEKGLSASAEYVSDRYEAGKKKIIEVTETAVGATENLINKGRSGIESAAHTIAEGYRTVSEFTSNSYDRAREAVLDVMGLSERKLLAKRLEQASLVAAEGIRRMELKPETKDQISKYINFLESLHTV